MADVSVAPPGVGSLTDEYGHYGPLAMLAHRPTHPLLQGELLKDSLILPSWHGSVPEYKSESEAEQDTASTPAGRCGVQGSLEDHRGKALKTTCPGPGGHSQGRHRGPGPASWV
ncbi:Oligosaccharyltransferase complex subunit OSTC [Manis javanica]|nr:Oligosaccharyltransferase complex subunit OSTC [Manis javanica]